MPSGVYTRKKRKSRKTRAIRAKAKASTRKKKRGPGRPKGSKTKKRGRPKGSKTKRAPAKKQAARPRVRAKGSAGAATISATQIIQPLIQAIEGFAKLLDARSKVLIEAINQISDSIRESADPELPAKVAIAQADKKAGAPQGEQASVSQ